MLNMKILNTNAHQDYAITIFIHLNVRLHIIMDLQSYKYEIRTEDRVIDSAPTKSNIPFRF